VNEPYLLWGLGLLGAALLLVVVEVLIPSAGVISLVATGAAITGVVALFKVSVWWGIAGILAVIVLGPMAALFGLNLLPSTPMGRKILFGQSGEDPVSKGGGPGPFDALVGREGVALTDLHPVGTVKVGSERVEALSETAWIPAGTSVRVTSADGLSVKVRAIQTPPA